MRPSLRLPLSTKAGGVPWWIALAIAVLGLAVLARFPIWAEIDERAHYAYVQSVAEQRQLPLIDDLVSPEVQAITDKTWPRPSPRAPAADGLAGRSYEAFQPPLYYLLAAPVFAVVPDHRQKVFALRAFNLLLIALAGAVLALAARAMAPPEHRALALTAGLLVLAWPGVLVRGVTVSNAPLELLLAPAFLLVAWIATKRRDARWLVAAGGLLGLCLLTKLTLVVVAPLLLVAFAAVWRGRPTTRERVAALLALTLPGVALAPWLLANRARVGQWTANTQAQEQQAPYLYPDGPADFGVADLPDRAVLLLDGALPQEWDAQLQVWWIALGARALILLLIAAIVLALVTGSRTTRRQAAFFSIPLAVSAIAAIWTLLDAQWDIFLLRYFQPVLPIVAIAAATALAARQPQWLKAGLVLTAALTAALWVDMAGAFLFTDVGDALGI